MQKLILPLLFVFVVITQVKAQQRLFDQAVQLKACNISIEANPFIATTVIEMEFYNDKDQEVEGLHSFRLQRGQVITGFQLELNGKYREGSIEERWKARQAYNSIVGKRIDPAILQMNGYNNYSINIYPIAARSSRKIKFTITQMMQEEHLKLTYTLPLQLKKAIPNFKLDIKVNRPASIPYVNEGILTGQLFTMKNEEAVLSQEANGIVPDQPISFSISQFDNQPQFCINKKNGTTNFLMRFFPDVDRFYPGKPRSINVYWDVSLSGKERNLAKELLFLETYIRENEISKTNIFLFNQQMQGIIVFDRSKDDFRSIRNYLLAYKYDGATDLGSLNFSNTLADAILLFSDGINSVGNARPKLGAVPVSFITTTYRYNGALASSIIGSTGGTVINLNYAEVSQAVKRIETIENFLFKYTSGNIHINEPFPVRLDGSLLLSGTVAQSDNLELFFGNNSRVQKSENYFISANETCDESTFSKMKMLKAYDSLMYGGQSYYKWQDMVVFGLTEKVITPQTSYLVLERIEDYINYKIAPPKELEQQCAERNYVYRSEYKIKALKTFTEQESLESVVTEYNKTVAWWSKDEALIDLNRTAAEQQNTDIAEANDGNKTKGSATVTDYRSVPGNSGNGLNEVVVTSAFGIKRTARSTSSGVQHLTSEQVNTIRQVNINNALAGKVAGMQVRSQSVAKLGAESMIRLRGENGMRIGSGVLYVVDGTIMPSASDINPDNIEDYTVLQGPAATALFGPDGANGAIVMTSKKAKRTYTSYAWTEYRLSSAKDEDYVHEMKMAGDYELWDIFLQLEKSHQMDAGFYFEMANLFFEKGKTGQAQQLMNNAIELCHGGSNGLRLAAFFYEKWQQFDKAIALYKGMLTSYPASSIIKRDLALAYYQNKNYEQAVRTYYSIVTGTTNDNNSDHIRTCALAEMNAILAMHANEFDISWINPNLVKILPVDLRITVESNHGFTDNVKFIEPGGTICGIETPDTKSGGRYTVGDYYRSASQFNHGIHEYIIKRSETGTYRVKVNAYDRYSGYWQIPQFIRVIRFKNFQQKNMKMTVELFDLDNQFGVVELDERS